MSDMMKVFVKQELDEQIQASYPHMRYPSCVCAKVVSVKKDDDVYVSTLKILDKNKQADARFPEIPMINTQIAISQNDIVVVLLLYGECEPYIIGRYE